MNKRKKVGRKSVIITPALRSYLDHLYDVAAEHEVSLADGDEVSDQELKEIAAEAWLRWDGTDGGVLDLARVRRFLTDVQTWCPKVDEIAVERAVDFDWGVIDNLTTLEYRELVDRLARMPDPFEWEDSKQIDLEDSGDGQYGESWSDSPRRNRFMEAGRFKWRRDLMTSVDRRRRELAGEEAQAA